MKKEILILRLKLFVLRCKILWHKIVILKCHTIIELCNFLVWIIQRVNIIKNKIKYLYYKLTTYNTDKIWQTCNQKCNCWPGTCNFGEKCKECEMWNGFSPKLKTQLEKECMNYANHCMTGG